MDDLIEALQIFRKYKNSTYPVHCEHDVMAVMDIHTDDVSQDDHKRLSELSFDWDDDDYHYYSFKFGSA